MGSKAGRRNTRIKGGGRRSSGRHNGPPDQSFTGKRKAESEKLDLARRLAVATNKDWVTPKALEYLRSLQDQGPLARPMLDAERAEAFNMLRAAKFIEYHGKAGSIPLYRLTSEGRAFLEQRTD